MSAAEIVTAAIAVVSRGVSILTAWLTLFRRGRLRMTRPNIIAFAFDASTPEVFLRFLLCSSAERGIVIENMYVAVSQRQKERTYSFWGYGDTAASLVRAGGLFVGREGVAVNHHFVLAIP